VPAALDEFCHAKVQDLGFASISDENIRGLNVAVDDSFLVRCFKSPHDLPGQIEELKHWSLGRGY
jgi:hypothetical protein